MMEEKAENQNPQGVATSELDLVRREVRADGTWKITGVQRPRQGTWRSERTTTETGIEVVSIVFSADSDSSWREEKLSLSRDGNRIAGMLLDPKDGTLIGQRQFYVRVTNE